MNNDFEVMHIRDVNKRHRDIATFNNETEARKYFSEKMYNMEAGEFLSLTDLKEGTQLLAYES